MANEFDPYYQWLGVPKHEQPPNHYRLLGIQLFESQPDVIQNAADQRMAHLKTFSTGPRGLLAQRVLNELSAAAACLLNPVKRKVYDAQLQTAMAASPPSDNRSTRPLESNTSAAVRVRPVRKRRKKGSPLLAIISLGGLVGLATIGYLYWPTNSKAPSARTTASVATPANQPSGTADRADVPANKVKKPVDSASSPPTPGKKSADQPATLPSAVSQQDPTAPMTGPNQPVGNQGDPSANPPNVSTPNAAGNNPSASAKQPGIAKPPTSITPAAPQTGPGQPTNPSAPSPIPTTFPPPGQPASSGQPDPGDPFQTGAPDSSATTKSRSAVVNLAEKDSYVELLDVTDIDKVQIAIVGVKNLPTSYHLAPTNGIVRSGQPVAVELDQPQGIRFRLSLDMKKAIAQLHVTPEMDFQRNETVDFSQARTKRAYRAAKKQMLKITRQLTATRNAYATIDTWLKSRGAKDRAARDHAVKQLKLLQNQIGTGQQQLLFTQNRASSLQQLAELADRIHNTTSIQFVVQPKTNESAYNAPESESNEVDP